jgi:hypothetical protein
MDSVKSAVDKMNINFCPKCKSNFIYEEFESHFCFYGKIIKTDYLQNGDIVLHLENGTSYTVTKKFLDYVKPINRNFTGRRSNHSFDSSPDQYLYNVLVPYHTVW